MKPTADDVVKAFKGLAIAAARARELAAANGKQGLLDDLPRRQKDAVRQHLLGKSRRTWKPCSES